MNFLKVFLASITGTIVAFFLIVLIMIIAFASSSRVPEPHIRPNSLLTIDMTGEIPARTAQDPFRDLFIQAPGDRVSLESLKRNLEKAAADDRIEGVWLRMNPLVTSWANLETAHNYLKRFKEESGKFIYTSTGDVGMNENAYFLASVSDSIFAPPLTYIEFNGFVMQTSYFSDMLDRIGIEPEIMRVGRYKSGVEPFLQEESSPENREQLEAILNQVLETFLTVVSENRQIDRETLMALMDQIPEDDVERAFREGLIDAIAHPHEVEEQIRQRLGLDEDESLRTVSLNRYDRVEPGSAGLERPTASDNIAILYAEGMILPAAVGVGPGTEPVITAEGIKRSLDSILERDDIGAIVVHINSGGGAVSTSELIYGHIREAASEKPVVAYMGSVAASGGYYIAMGADSVMVSPNTITGSIGIYNLMFDTSELFNDKLGIHFETFKTHEHADITLMNRPLTESERSAMQRSIESGYEAFLARVSGSRGMNRDEVHEIAQGRVWTGQQAVEIDLADRTGSLEDAVAMAAEMAGLERYGTVTYPEHQELLEMLFSTADTQVRNWIGSLIPFSDEIRSVQELMNHDAGRNWAVMPLRFTIE